MAQYSEMGERGGPVLKERLLTIVRACQECHDAWIRAVDPRSRDECSRIYRIYIEELFQLLEPDLERLVSSWLDRRLRQSGPHEREFAPEVRQEGVDMFVLNTFTYIAERLPYQALEEGSDVHVRLLALAEDNLSRHF